MRLVQNGKWQKMVYLITKVPFACLSDFFLKKWKINQFFCYFIPYFFCISISRLKSFTRDKREKLQNLKNYIFLQLADNKILGVIKPFMLLLIARNMVIWVVKFPKHTDRILVEMFHNYAFKECLSVEKLKLWLLILTKTLF